MSNPFVHVELQTRDLAKAKEFYGALFGWQLDDVPKPGGGTYTLIKVGEGTGGGMFANDDPNVPPQWLAYVGVDDVRESTRKAQELGATVCVDVMEIGEYGIMSVIVDPTGAALAMWQAKPGNCG